MSQTARTSPERGIEASGYTIWTLVQVFVAGVGFGVIGAFLQSVVIDVGPVAGPFWMVVLLAAMLATARALTLHYGSRKPAVLWFLGWIAVSMLLSLPLPGGDQVIADGLTQAIYVFGGAVLGGLFISLPAGLRQAGPNEGSPADPTDSRPPDEEA